MNWPTKWGMTELSEDGGAVKFCCGSGFCSVQCVKTVHKTWHKRFLCWPLVRMYIIAGFRLLQGRSPFQKSGSTVLKNLFSLPIMNTLTLRWYVLTGNVCNFQPWVLSFFNINNNNLCLMAEAVDKMMWADLGREGVWALAELDRDGLRSLWVKSGLADWSRAVEG